MHTGALGVTVLYLLVKFPLCFWQDYYRWSLIKEVSDLTQLGRSISRAFEAVPELKELLAKLTTQGKLSEGHEGRLQQILNEVEDRTSGFRRIKRENRALWGLQVLRFFVLELGVALAVSLIAVWLGAGSAIELIGTVIDSL